jgi:hypothetical protein
MTPYRRKPPEPLGIISSVVAAMNRAYGAPLGGVAEAARGVRLAFGEPMTVDEFADLVTAELLGGDLVKEVCERHSSDLVRLRLVRADSQPQTQLRRFQQFLRDYVWLHRIPEDRLPPQVRIGRLGGRPPRR